MKLATLRFTNNLPEYDNTKRRKCWTDNKWLLILVSVVRCCFCDVKIHEVRLNVSEVVTVGLYISCGYSQTRKDISVERFQGIWDKII